VKHLQTYRLFESTRTLTKEQKAFLDKYVGVNGTWKLNPGTGKIDIDGAFFCHYEGLKNEDFLGLSFGTVSRYFTVEGNSLQGMSMTPRRVGEGFTVSENENIGSLKGGPEYVGGSYVCMDCNLESLEGVPKKVGGDFVCNNNNLRTLAGAPLEVGGGFYCSGNPLVSLEGSPRIVKGNFKCEREILQSIKGAPEVIGGEFIAEVPGGELIVPAGEWSFETLLKMWVDPNQEEYIRRILLTYFDPETLQQMIDQNPEKMLIKMKEHLKDPHFKGLKWPKHLEKEKDLLSDLSDVGL
jgi:hypothetical protein